jgi:hypothetical protein
MDAKGVATPKDVRQLSVRSASSEETNCGPTPCTTFDATEQFVSTTGQNAYASPAADEIRGPCPGLNAAANHGYLPRSGVATLENSQCFTCSILIENES